MTDDREINFEITDEEGVQREKDQYIRELKLQEMFENAPDELKNIIEEAKSEPMDDLIYQPHQNNEE